LIRQSIRSTVGSWFWFVLIGTVIGAAIAFGAAVVAPSTYTARVTLLVAPTPKTTGITNSDLAVAQAYIPTLAELATIRPILDRVISQTHVSTDADAVTTHVPVGTSLLTISVSNPDAANASILANAIASELISQSAGSDSNGGLELDLTIVEPATPPIGRDGPGLPIRVALGGAIALFLTISIAFLVENVGRGAQSLGRGVGVGRRPEGLVRSQTDPDDDLDENAAYGTGFGPSSESAANQSRVSMAEAGQTAPALKRDGSGRFLASGQSKPRTS
jgi:capsular polysaccharide biosynthesis protein